MTLSRSLGVVLFALSLFSVPAMASRLDNTTSPGGADSCAATATGFTYLDFTPTLDGGENLQTGTQLGAFGTNPPDCPLTTEVGVLYQVGEVPGFPGTTPDPTFEAGQSFTVEVNNSSATWGVYSNGNNSPEINGTGCPGDSGVLAFFASCTDFSDGTTFTLSSSYLCGPSSNEVCGAIFYTDPGALQFISTTLPDGTTEILYGNVVPEPRMLMFLAVMFAGVIGCARYMRRRLRY